MERRDGCGEVCISYDGPEPEYEPTYDELVRESLHELERADRERGVELPPRNPGRVEDGGPAWWLVVAILLVWIVGTLLVLVVP